MSGTGDARTSGPLYSRGITVLGPQIRRVLIGFFLIAAFAATGTVLLFVITADQLQNSMSSPDLATTKSSIGAIRQDVATVEYYYNVLDVISRKQVETEEGLSKANIEAQSALARMTSSADDINSFINQNDTAYILPPLLLKPFGQSAPSHAPGTTMTVDGKEVPLLGSSPASAAHPAPAAAGGGTLAQAPILDFGGMVTGYFAQYYQQLGPPSDANAAAHKALDAFKGQVYKLLAPYAQAHAQYDAAMTTVASLTAQRAALDKQKTELDDSVAPKGSSLANDAYWNLCEDFYSFKTLVGDGAYKIVLLPKMMLILTLSIFMGILGSLIYLAQEFLHDPSGRPFWDILFRIGLGAGVAFALFFFAAAGMLAMTQSANGTGQANMSPYLISFLGITGGYLSDRVMQWMREVGENTFKVAGTTPPRWAIGLDAALKAAGLSSAQLASATSETTADTDAWIALTKPVPGDRQALVAAFLREHPSKLFTDIQPG